MNLFRNTGVASILFLGACIHATDPAESESSEEGATATLTCDVKSYGAKGDGVTKDTAAIQAAIDACGDKGGEVHLRQGTYLSGMIRLKSNMTFHVHGGATLKGTQDDQDYPDTNPATKNSQLHNCKKTLVYAEGVHDLHLTGTGIIDGNGNTAKWLGGSKSIPEAQRPMAIFVTLSQKVTIDSLTVKNAAMWSVVNMETDNLLIQNLTVSSTQGSTKDGIDIVDCHHVVVEGCTVSSEDDSICLKSGVARGVDDVIVRNCHVLTSGVANALKLGTASVGSFTNVTFDTIDVQHADKAAMAVESVDGAKIENIVFRNITFHDVGTPFFALIGRRGGPGPIGSIDGVRFESITGDSVRHDWGAVVSGLEQGGTIYPIKNVAFQDVHVTMRGGVGAVPASPPEYVGQYPDPNLWGQVPAAGIFFRHVNGVSFVRSSIDVAPIDARPVTVAVDAASFMPPTCDVTFTVRTDIDAPKFDPSSDGFRILGKTTEPSGIPALAADPLSAWKAANPGLDLTPTTADPSGRSRFLGHATIPQGSTIEFKTVVGKGTAVRYERSSLGNRTAVIPNAAAAAIDLDWQN